MSTSRTSAPSASRADQTLPNARLLIGLGGLGTATVLAAHNELKSQKLSHFRTIVIDTDDPRINLDGVDDQFMAQGAVDIEDQQIQVVRLTGQNLQDWRGQNPHILDGVFPMHLPASVSSGAAKQRIVGSAAGFANAVEIRSAIESSIDQVRQESGVDHGVLVVNIATGSSGGSGSSNVRLITALVHDVFHKNYDAGQVRLEIRVVIVLPDCYSTVPELRPIIERNAVWTLRELDAAQRDGASFRIPNGGGGHFTVSVPPGYLHTILCISGRSAAGNIPTTTALQAMSTYLTLDADPVIGKALVDELVDIYPDFGNPNRQTMGISAHQLRLADTTDTLRALRRRQVAQAFLGLPAPAATEVTALADQLVPLTFSQFSGGSRLPEHDVERLVHGWILSRSGVASFSGMGRALATMVGGFRTQDETGRSAPTLRGGDITSLAESLIGLRFVGVTVAKPNINLDPEDIKASGSAATSRVLDEVDRAVGDYRNAVQSFFAGQDPDVATPVGRFVDLHDGEDMSNLGTQLRAAFQRLEQTVSADSGEIRSTLGRLASSMEQAREAEGKAGKAMTWRPSWLGGAVHEAPATGSLDHASDIVGRAHSYAQSAFARVLATEWNAFIGRVNSRADEVVTSRVGSVVSSARDTARRWNGYISDVQRIVRGLVGSLDSISRFLQDVVDVSIPEPVVPETDGFHRIVGATVSALEAMLPAINPREQANGIDIFADVERLLDASTIQVSTGELFTSNPVVNQEIAKILRGGAYLSFNPSRCGGAVVTRIFMSGPESLQRHPVVKEKLSRNELRFEVVPNGEVNILIVVTGILLGAISGVEAWERQLHGAANELAVSSLECLRLGSLIQVNEALIIEPFLGALIGGEQVPTTPDKSNPWSYCSADAMLRSRATANGNLWLLYPYPGVGRSPEKIGASIMEAFGAFKLDVGDCRGMASRRLGDLVKAFGWASLVKQTQRFADALLPQVTALGEELALPSDTEDPAEERKLHAKRQLHAELQWLCQAAIRWSAEKSRTLGK